MAAQPVTTSPEASRGKLSVSGDDGKDPVLVHSGSTDSLSLEEKSSHNPFLDPKVAAHYQDLYEKSGYECRHVFDPDLEWTEEEEKKIIRKLDWRVTLWACIMFFALNVDRKNLTQAVSGTLLKDLSLTTNDYNYGNTIFLISFLLAEVPSQLVSKKVGPDRWIPIQMTLWSIVAAAQAGIRGKAGFYACRALLGLLEGGFIPDLVLWLSYFYKSTELPVRLSMFWTALNLTVVISSLMAAGLLQLDGVHGVAGWRWLLLIEGLITLVIGLASFFLMPASAVQTKAWFRPNGWFTEREEAIVVNRVLRDDPSKGDMHNRMAITPRKLWAALKDYDLWPLYAIGVIAYVPQSPPSAYLTLILKQLGFSTLQTNLLSIPAEVASCFTLIGLTYLSERINERSMISSLQNWWTLACLFALRFWPGLTVDAWGTYALVTVLLSYPYCHAIVVGWTSRNSGSVRTRTISAAMYNMMVQVGNVYAANIYRTDDAPTYHRGNSVLIGLDIVGLVIFFATKAYYMWRNKTREAKWAAMSEEQKQEYIETTKDQGNKRLDFRFAH